MNMTFKRMIACAAVFTLSGCSFLSPVKTTPEAGYVINAAPCNVTQSKRHSGVMLVMMPDTSSAYNTSRMAFTVRQYQISYYANSRWIEGPSEMMLPLLTKTLQKTQRFKAVLSPPYSGQTDYALRTQIKTLLIDYTSCVPVLRLTMQEDLLSAYSGRLIASREFTTTEQLPQKSPYGAVYAANQATKRLLAQIAAWVVRNT